MAFSEKAQTIYDQISGDDTKHGDLRKIAKKIKRDHELAMELWYNGGYFPRQLAILIMDKKLLTEELLGEIFCEIEGHEPKERTHLADWLMANQLMKDKKLTALMESWEDNPSKMQRRLYWYYKARLRWMGNTPPPPDSEELLDRIEQKILDEEPEVQWAMNFTAGQIGVFEADLRNRCISIGETTGLYKEEKVPKNCTPNYLPGYIAVEVAKRS